MELRPGQRLYSAVSEAEFVVVKAPTEPIELLAGGVAMLAEPGGDAAAGDVSGEPAQLGKRYADDELGLELLCSKGGAGELSAAGRPLGLKGAKPLPSSD